MKKILLTLLAVALLVMTASTAEADRWRRGRPGFYRPLGPPVRVVPRYYGPVYPVYPARPYYVRPYGYDYYGLGPRVYVPGGYYGGEVLLRTPGFGLSIGY
ncbi:MAG: hypothetical protein ACYC0X_02515 [Pirellulaceae bacterium]